MELDQNKWYVYCRGWEMPCYEVYTQDDEVKDGFQTRKQAREWIKKHRDDKEFNESFLLAAKG
jgi:hypothetical protein